MRPAALPPVETSVALALADMEHLLQHLSNALDVVGAESCWAHEIRPALDRAAECSRWMVACWAESQWRR